MTAHTCRVSLQTLYFGLLFDFTELLSLRCWRWHGDFCLASSIGFDEVE